MQPYRTDRLEQWAKRIESGLSPAAIVRELLEADRQLEHAAQRLLGILQVDELRAAAIICLYENGRTVLHLRMDRKVTVCGRDARHCGVEQGRWLRAAANESDDEICPVCAPLASEFAETRRSARLSLTLDEKAFVVAAAEAALDDSEADLAVQLLEQTARALFEVAAARVIDLGQGWIHDRWLRRPLALKRWLQNAYPHGTPLVGSGDIVTALESSPALLLRLLDGLGPTWQHTPLYEDVVPWLLVHRWPEVIEPLTQWAQSPHGRDPLVQQLNARVHALHGSR